MRRISILFGHRGAGKTSFLRGLAATSELAARKFFDLDQEIEKAGPSVSSIFSGQGEEAFRQLEFQTLEKILSSSETTDAVIALGAGFRLDEWRKTACAEKWAAEVEWIWLRRVSDERGRIFLDRPRLNVGLAPLDEFELRYQAREPVFHRQADFILDLPEGNSEHSFEYLRKLLMNRDFRGFGGQGIYTLTAGSREHASVLQERLLALDLAAIELRSDLLSPADFLYWHKILPFEKQLLSSRGRGFPKGADPTGVFGVDWALEEGHPEIPASIVSLHEGHRPQRFQDYEGKAHLKWAPVVESFEELFRGFEWQQADPDHRSFLPRSLEGRWTWFRQLMKGRQKINFVRMGPAGPVTDQPSFLEWLETFPKASFAALVGDPVWHSQTPSEQGGYFAAKNLSTFKIRLSEDEWNIAFPILEKMGLRAAAVTSPLKIKAAQLPGHKSVKVRSLGSANTLALQQGAWSGENTDEGGLCEAADRLRDLTPTLVWGGGGTLSMLQALWPSAHFYSVRSSGPREGMTRLTTSPRLVIWAAGPRDPAPALELLTQGEKNPEVVLDLNYREDSAARELSIRLGARYISGLEFFRAQARLQREFWDQTL